MEPQQISIKFYGTQGVMARYFPFSNFSRHPITIDNVVWRTSEHYYQAMKYNDPALRERVRACVTPREAAAIGRDRTLPIRPDWEQVKEDVMRVALRAKFTQHASIRRLLLDTGDATLVEHTRNDRYWGDGGDGSGRNRLGALLMELRTQLRA